jgi:hypothetical protein
MHTAPASHTVAAAGYRVAFGSRWGVSRQVTGVHEFVPHCTVR